MTTETPVNVPFLDEPDLLLKLALGACRVRVRPGGVEPWATGTYTDPTDDLPIRLVHEGGTVTMTQGRAFAGIVGLVRGGPTLDLALGTGRPFALRLEGGAFDVELELGGVSLTRLTTRHGAGKLEIGFATPNPVDMAAMELSVGAGALEIDHLGNANTASLRIEGGAAGYEIDLTGQQRPELDGSISTAMSGVSLLLEPKVPARIRHQATLGGVNVGDGFTTREGAVWTVSDPAVAPRIRIEASIALGGLKVRLAD